MMNHAGIDLSRAEEPWAPLVDVSRLSLASPPPDTDGILGRSLRRVLDSLHDRDGVISAFSSAFPERR